MASVMISSLAKRKRSRADTATDTADCDRNHRSVRQMSTSKVEGSRPDRETDFDVAVDAVTNAADRHAMAPCHLRTPNLSWCTALHGTGWAVLERGEPGCAGQ